MDTDFEFATDLVIKNGDISLLTHDLAMGQTIRDRLTTFRGEWFLDLQFGPDYRNDILIKNPELSTISSIFRDEILKSVDGKFIAFDVKQNSDRSFTMTFTLDTTNGVISDTITI